MLRDNELYIKVIALFFDGAARSAMNHNRSERQPHQRAGNETPRVSLSSD